MARIISVEGLPGAGKTTIIEMIVHDLEERGVKVGMVDIETTADAPILRPMTRQYPPGHPSRIMLFWILRLQQYDVMLKMIENGADVVIADRYWGSTMAFDVYGNRLPREVVDWIGRYIVRQPDITLYFEAPLDVVRQRKESTTMKDLEFARRVEQGYKLLANELSWIRIDATEEPEQVRKRCLEIILAAL